MKYSSELIYAAVGFMQAANRELGDIADEKLKLCLMHLILAFDVRF